MDEQKKVSAWQKPPQENIDRFNQLMNHLPGVRARKMFGFPCAFFRGNMFFGLHQANFFLRLSLEDRAEIKSNFGADLFEPLPGRVMKEYVVLPVRLLNDDAALEAWLGRSLKFIQTLPEKKEKGK